MNSDDSHHAKYWYCSHDYLVHYCHRLFWFHWKFPSLESFLNRIMGFFNLHYRLVERTSALSAFKTILSVTCPPSKWSYPSRVAFTTILTVTLKIYICIAFDLVLVAHLPSLSFIYQNFISRLRVGCNSKMMLLYAADRIPWNKQPFFDNIFVPFIHLRTPIIDLRVPRLHFIELLT